MAVFKEKNGALKAVGYLRGRTNAQIQPGLLTFEQSISPHFHVVRESAYERNVRAAATTSDGSVRRGGGNERKS